MEGQQSNLSVGEAAAEYLAHLKQRVRRKQMQPETLKGYTQRLGVFASWCDAQNITLAGVRNKVVNDFMEHLQTEHKPNRTGQEHMSSHTLAGYSRVISAFLHWCLQDEEYDAIIKPVVVSRIKPFKPERIVIETYTPEEVDALYGACNQEVSGMLQLRDQAILYLLLDTGIRADELCTLTIGNTVLKPIEDAHIRVFGKGQKWREVPIGTKARRKVQEYIRYYRKEAKKDEPLFLNRYHQVMTVNGLEQLVRRLGEWAGLSIRCYPHKFRHTFAREFMRNGGDIFDLSRMMGHESVSVTEEYLKALTGQDVRRRKDRKSVLDNM